MSWIADAHSQWHTAHGWDQVCPLDCGIGEGQDDYDQEEPTAEMIAEAEAWKVAQEEEWSSLTWV